MDSVIERLKSEAPPTWLQMSLGAAAGFFASGPMGLLMVGLKRLLPESEQTPLPPQEITMEMAERVGVKGQLAHKPQRRMATWLSHFGYGAVVGSIYPLAAQRIPAPVYVKGMLFGLLVWAVSYLGWVPAAQILPPATEQPWRRNALMIAAHLLWGGLIGVIVDTAEKGR